MRATPRHARRRFVRFVHLLTALTPLTASAALCAEHVVLTESLELRRGTIVSADGRGVALSASDGTVELIPAAACVGFSDASIGLQVDPRQGLLLFADGQRLPGRPEVRAGGLHWRHETLGSIKVELEEIEAIVLSFSMGVPIVGERDVVLLRNGDRLEGIVESLGEEIELVQSDGSQSDGRGERRLKIPFERIANLALVTPTRPGTGSRLWFRDGTVLDAQRPTIGSGLVHVAGIALATRPADPSAPAPTPSGTAPTRLDVSSLSVPISLVRGVQFSAAPITPVARLVPISIEAPPERFSAPMPQLLDIDPPLGLARLRLSGPMVLRMALPSDAARLVAALRLPEEALPWGSVAVTLRDMEGIRWSGVLDVETRSAFVDVEVAGRYIEVELGEAANGPIGDFIVVDSGLVSSTKPR